MRRSSTLQPLGWVGLKNLAERLLGIIRNALTLRFFSIYTEPIKPVIEVPKYGQDIPLDDVDAVTMKVGDNVTSDCSVICTILGFL